MLNNIKTYIIIKKSRAKHIKQMKKAQVIAESSHQATQMFESSGFKNRMEDKLNSFDHTIKELSKASLTIRIMKMVGF